MSLPPPGPVSPEPPGEIHFDADTPPSARAPRNQRVLLALAVALAVVFVAVMMNRGDSEGGYTNLVKIGQIGASGTDTSSDGVRVYADGKQYWIVDGRYTAATMLRVMKRQYPPFRCAFVKFEDRKDCIALGRDAAPDATTPAPTTITEAAGAVTARWVVHLVDERSGEALIGSVDSPLYEVVDGQQRAVDVIKALTDADKSFELTDPEPSLAFTCRLVGDRKVSDCAPSYGR